MNTKRTKAPQADQCPDRETLWRYGLGTVKDVTISSMIQSHLDVCPKCRERFEKVREEVQDVQESIKHHARQLTARHGEMKRQAERGPLPGTLWRTVPKQNADLFGPIVMVLYRHGQGEKGPVSVAEVSERIDKAIHTDMVLDPKESGFSFRFMIRAANVFATRADSLKAFVGRLSPELTKRVLGFCEVAAHFDENVALSEYIFGRDPNGTELMRRKGITSGMLVTRDDDPRLRFSKVSRQGCAYLAMNR